MLARSQKLSNPREYEYTGSTVKCGIISFFTFPIACVFTLLAHSAFAESNEVTVTLFGQPCLLSGSFDKNTLKAIHAISPEQTYPAADSAPTADALRKGIDRLKSTTGIPPAFDRYKDRLLKRFEGQVKFADALSAARKSGKAESLLTPLKPLLTGKSREKDFETLAKKIDAAKTADADLALQLLDIFNEMIEPDPEDDFHKTVQKTGVRYTCDFSDEGDEEESAE